MALCGARQRHHRKMCIRDRFKADIDRTVNWLREQPDSPLRDFDSMNRYCNRYEQICAIKGALLPSCGFMVKTKRYVYMLRCTPVKGDYLSLIHIYLLTAGVASLAGFEPTAFRLGATSFGSCLVVRHASKCPQTRMNTGFFIELPVAEYLKISPNIGSFCTQIEPAIRQILDRFSAVTPNTGDSLELSYPII